MNTFKWYVNGARKVLENSLLSCSLIHTVSLLSKPFLRGWGQTSAPGAMPGQGTHMQCHLETTMHLPLQWSHMTTLRT